MYIARLRTVSNCLKAACISSLMVFTILSLPMTVAAAGTATVGFSPSNQTLSPGQTFSLNIDVQPNNAITGVQVSFAFDPSVVTVKSVSEGNLFKQSGASSFFVPGSIDNVKGIVSDICGVIIGSGKNVSNAGTLAVVVLTAGTKDGNTPLTLSDVLIGDQNGKAILSGISNGQATVSRPVATPTPSPVASPTPTPTSSPAPPFMGGGGGGGPTLGGGTNGATTSAGTMPVDASGNFAQDYSVKSSDGMGNLSVPKGTLGKSQGSKPLSDIKFTNVVLGSDASGPQLDPDIVGLVYDLSPEGATFDPPISLSINYDPRAIPAGVDQNNLAIAYWSQVSLKWEKLSESNVDSAKHQVSVSLNHFSKYTIVVDQPGPAVISLSDLLISSAEAKIGQELRLSAVATNSGESAGSLKATLKVDGSMVETREINLAGKSAQNLTFIISAEGEGDHEIEINDLTVRLKVLASDLPLSTPEIKDSASANQARSTPDPVNIEGQMGQDSQESNAVGADNFQTSVEAGSLTQPKTTEFRLSLLILAIGTALLLVSITVAIVLLKSRNLRRYYL
jgi:hypothetical protein